MKSFMGFAVFVALALLVQPAEATGGRGRSIGRGRGVSVNVNRSRQVEVLRDNSRFGRTAFSSRSVVRARAIQNFNGFDVFDSGFCDYDFGSRSLGRSLGGYCDSSLARTAVIREVIDVPTVVERVVNVPTIIEREVSLPAVRYIEPSCGRSGRSVIQRSPSCDFFGK